VVIFFCFCLDSCCEAETIFRNRQAVGCFRMSQTRNDATYQSCIPVLLKVVLSNLVINVTGGILKVFFKFKAFILSAEVDLRLEMTPSFDSVTMILC
jgi:hypothetical protein